MTVEVKAFFHKPSSTWSYVVMDEAMRRAAVVDPALDFDPASGRTGTASAQALVDLLRTRRYTLDWILETHAHADHLSAAQFVKKEAGGKVAIGEGILKVQQTFKGLYNLGADFKADGSDFDHLFKDGENFAIGKLQGRIMATPGHTSDGVSYVIDDTAFVGDTLFMPDSGTGRADFPGGDAGALYDSIQKILALPEDTRLFMCHDYGAGGREHRYETSVWDEREENIHLKGKMSRNDYIKLRQTRDKTLPVPALLLPAIQVNIRAGRLPEPDPNGVSYLRIPLNKF